MTLAAVARNDAIGAGNTDDYPFTFGITAETDLVVTQRNTSDVETTLSLGVHYEVSAGPWPSGGTITLLAGNLTADYALTIRRVRPLTQDYDAVNGAANYAEDIEAAIDNAMMVAQQLRDELDRTPRLGDTDAAFTGRLPARDLRAGKFGTYDAEGNPAVAVGTGADSALRTDLAASGGAALSGYIAEGTGAVATSIQGKLRRTWRDLEDFGTKHGSNDTATIQRGIDWASSVYGDLVVDGRRWYGVGVIALKSNMTWVGLSRVGSIIDLNEATAVVNCTDQNEVHVRDITFEKLNMQVNMLSICASASVAQQKRHTVKGCRFITNGATPDANTASLGVYGPSANVDTALNTLDIEVLDNYIQFAHIGTIVKYGATRTSVLRNRMIQVGTDATAEGSKFEQVINGLFGENIIVMGAAALSALTVQDGTIGSRFYNSILDISLGATYGLRGEYGGFAYATDNDFINNTILGSGSNTGIYGGYHGLTGWTIKGNRLQDCGYNWLGDSTKWRDNRVEGVAPSTAMLFPGTLGEYEHVFEWASLANNAAANIILATVTTTLAGMLQVEYLSNAGAYKVGLYIVNGAVLNVAVPATMDDTKDNASTLNVYIEAGFIVVQNKLGATATDIVLRFKGRNSN